MESNIKRSYIYAGFAILFWSTVATVFKLTLIGMNNAQLLFYSSFISLIILFLLMLRFSRRELNNFFKWKVIQKNAVLGFINPFIYYLILFKAYSMLPAHEAQPLNLIWPIVISIFSVIFLKQKFSVKTIIGLVISFLGIVIIATRGDLFAFHFHNLFGVLLAVSSAFIWAAYWILNLLDTREESVKLFGAFFYGTIFTGIYLALFDSFTGFEIKYLMGAVYVGIFEMGITFYFWLKALSLSNDKAKTSTLIYLFPVISMILIYIFLNEDISASAPIGLLLIIGGILIQRYDELKFRKG